MTIRVHHLLYSRSIRILWLMEELGLDYELIEHRRDRMTRRAPASLLDAHPLGKAPVIEVDGRMIAESGAIVEYVADRFGDGRLAPAASAPDRAAYLEWLHYAEGSAMLPMMLRILGKFRGGLPDPIAEFADTEAARTLEYLNGALAPGSALLAGGFSAADIQVHYVVAAARWLGMIDDYPPLAAYLERLETRPAFLKAVEIGGPAFPPTR